METESNAMNGAPERNGSTTSLKDEVAALENGAERPKMGAAIRGTRIGHKKSRNGCQQCKKRRVKVSSVPLFRALVSAASHAKLSS